MINCLLPDVADGIAYDFVCCMVMDYVETMLWTRFLCVDIAVDLLNFASSNFQFMFLMSTPFLCFSSNSTHMFDNMLESCRRINMVLMMSEVLDCLVKT